MHNFSPRGRSHQNKKADERYRPLKQHSSIWEMSAADALKVNYLTQITLQRRQTAP